MDRIRVSIEWLDENGTVVDSISTSNPNESDDDATRILKSLITLGCRMPRLAVVKTAAENALREA